MGLIKSSLIMNQTIPLMRLEGAYNEFGKYVITEIMENIKGMVQPYRRTQTGSQTILPEGVSSEDVVVIWTSTLLRSSNEYDEDPADVILYQGRRFEIQDVSSWSGYSGLINQHYECLAVLETKAG